LGRAGSSPRTPRQDSTKQHQPGLDGRPGVTVNPLVVGSSPTRGAEILPIFALLCHPFLNLVRLSSCTGWPPRWRHLIEEG
jgi:hypothetical protein